MSTKYPGGFITKSPVAPTTTAASGIWTLDQQQQAQKAGTWPSPPVFIEDMFSTYLYTGVPGGAVTVNNGINLSGQGGLVWVKRRDGATNHLLADTARGGGNMLQSNTSDAESVQTDGAVTFNTNGFTTGSAPSAPFVSWTFKEQAKFFDIVTWTGDGTAPRTINHNLGSTPGCIIVKRVSGGFGEDWHVFHRSLTAGQNLVLNSTAASASGSIGSPTSTTFTISSAGSGNSSGYPYVAYLFAHDAGGFPVSGGGSTNGISCGSFTIDGSGKFTVNLGYEPQWIMIKLTNFESNWSIFDNMRGMPVGSPTTRLLPNLSDAESSAFSFVDINATGFAAGTGSGNPYSPDQTWIYVAIRRGPMKTPAVGTSVFAPVTYTSNFTNNRLITTGILTDGVFARYRDAVTNIGVTVGNRLTGNNFLGTAVSSAEYTNANGFSTPTAGYGNGFSAMNGFGVGIDTSALLNYDNGYNAVAYSMQRASGFFDVVCYTGTLANLTLTHNLGVAPEMMIVKCRSSATPGGIAANWAVYAAPQGNSKFALLNTTDLFGTSAVLWQATTPTASNFYVGAANYVNGSAETYVAYLFASVAGVSKVGTYTGTGALLTVDCGFTSGARFVLIKRADTSGDWWTYDSVRGITAGNDPYLYLNTTAAEVTGTNYVDTDTTGFKVTAAAPAGLNASGGTYIFLAIA